MKGHLINFKSNGIKSIIKVNVFFEIHAMVSRVTVSDEICENPYLRESPCSFLFEPKFSLSLIQIYSLSSIQSFWS